jgi:hypothetical protein
MYASTSQAESFYCRVFWNSLGSPIFLGIFEPEKFRWNIFRAIRAVVLSLLHVASTTGANPFPVCVWYAKLKLVPPYHGVFIQKIEYDIFDVLAPLPFHDS